MHTTGPCSALQGVYGKIYSTSEFSYQDAEHGEKKAPKKELAIAETKKPKQEPQNESTVATGTSEKASNLVNDIGIGIYTDKQLIRNLYRYPGTAG